MYLLRLDSRSRSRFLQIKQPMAIPPAFLQAAVDGVPFPPLFENLLLGAEPVLFVLAGFTTTAFVELIGPLSDHVVGWGSAWHHRHLARRAFRADRSLWRRLCVSLAINHRKPPGAAD